MLDILKRFFHGRRDAAQRTPIAVTPLVQTTSGTSSQWRRTRNKRKAANKQSKKSRRANR